jgi:hypothetical protein
MVAIVNAAAELRIQIRTAAPASVAASFIESHTPTLGGKPDRSGEASETGADDMCRTQPRYHTRPCRNTSQSLSGFDTFTRVAGSRHPERNRTDSVAW